MKNIISQVGIEFITLMGIALIVVIFIAAISAKEIKDFQNQKEFILIKDLGLKLQKEISIASTVEDGYSRQFNLPDKLDFTLEYFIITSNVSISINSSKSVFTTAILNVTGEFIKGDNTIEKIGGQIYINR